MAKSEADEVAELKSMFKSPSNFKSMVTAGGGTIPMNRRPPWDSTPLRNRPTALIGLKPVTREPWAIDEDVYNRRFETRDVGIQDRYLDKTARSRQMGTQLIDYMCRFDNKYAELNGTYDRYDGNPFT